LIQDTEAQLFKFKILFTLKKSISFQVWDNPAILPLEKLMQEDLEFKSSWATQ
jgi:hypothetical protein